MSRIPDLESTFNVNRQADRTTVDWGHWRIDLYPDQEKAYLFCWGVAQRAKILNTEGTLDELRKHLAYLGKDREDRFWEDVQALKDEITPPPKESSIFRPLKGLHQVGILFDDFTLTVYPGSIYAYLHRTDPVTQKITALKEEPLRLTDLSAELKKLRDSGITHALDVLVELIQDREMHCFTTPRKVNFDELDQFSDISQFQVHYLNWIIVIHHGTRHHTAYIKDALTKSPTQIASDQPIPALLDVMESMSCEVPDDLKTLLNLLENPEKYIGDFEEDQCP
jgi:hypothetical protein